MYLEMGAEQEHVHTEDFRFYQKLELEIIDRLNELENQRSTLYKALEEVRRWQRRTHTHTQAKQWIRNMRCPELGNCIFHEVPFHLHSDKEKLEDIRRAHAYLFRRFLA